MEHMAPRTKIGVSCNEVKGTMDLSTIPRWSTNTGLVDDGSRDSFDEPAGMEHMAPHYRSLDHSPTDGLVCSKTRKNKEEKYCGVCGDRALGYNFDAISCESCKAFFRRNAPKGLDYFKCPYEEKCKMDVSNRRFCKRCRLRKCFEIGMRKEYILTDEEKMRKRQRIEENRQRSSQAQQPSCSQRS